MTQNHTDMLNLAIQKQQEGNIKEAIKLYSEYMKKGTLTPGLLSNYAIACEESGNNREAKELYKKSINLFPNFANSYANLGNLLNQEGKNSDGLIYIKKALHIREDVAEYQIIFANILHNLKEYKKSESAYLNAIKLKPDLAETYYNYASLMFVTGELEKAEKLMIKYIEIKPRNSKARSQLGLILRSRGKLNESSCQYRYVLKSEKTEIELRIISLISLCINHLVKGNIKQFNELSNLLKKYKINNLKKSITKKKNEEFIYGYGLFILELNKILTLRNPIKEDEKIPHIGESHCLSFAHQNVYFGKKIKTIQPILITGAKAWHLGNKFKNQFKSSFEEQIRKYKRKNQEILISFGEIDCRSDEGIINFSNKNRKNYFVVCEKTIIDYINYMEKNLKKYFEKRYYLGIPAPFPITNENDELHSKRKKLIKFFNQNLKKETKERGAYFIDVYSLTVDENGENNKLYMCDKYHLSPKYLNELIQNNLGT